MGGEAYIRIAVSTDSTTLSALDTQVKLVSADTDKMAASFANASGRTAALTEKMGGLQHAEAVATAQAVGLTHAMARVAAETPGVSSALAAGFAVFGVTAIVGVIDNVIERVGKAKDAVTGAEVVWLRASSSVAAHSASLEVETLKLRDEISVIEARPATNGMAIALREADIEAERLFASLSKDIEAEGTLLKEKKVGILDSFLTGARETGDISDALRAPLLQLDTALSKQVEVYRKTTGAIADDSKPVAQQLAKNARDVADAEVEAQRRAVAGIVESLQTGVHGLEAQKAAAIRALERPVERTSGGVYGPDRTPAALSHAEAEKKVNEQYAAREAILAGLSTSLLEVGKSEQDIKGIAPLEGRLAGDKLAEKARQQSLRDEEYRLAAHKRFLDTMKELQREEASTIRDNRMEAEEGVTAEVRGVEERAAAMRAGSKDRIALYSEEGARLKGMAEEQASVLAFAKESGTHEEFEIERAYYNRLLALVHDFESRLATEKREGNEQRIHLADEAATREYEATVRQIQASARISEAQVGQARMPGKTGRVGISPEQESAQRIAIIQDELKKELAANEMETASVSAMQGDQTAKVQALADKRVEIEQQAALKIAEIQRQTAARVSAEWERRFAAINGPLNTAVGAMLNGSERVSVAFARMGSSILTSAVNSMVQWAVKTAEQILVVEILEHSSLARRIVVHTAAMSAKMAQETATLTAEITQLTVGAAARQAITTTGNSAVVVSDAGVAAAAAAASAIEALPFPFNLAAAPGAAAAAMAEVMAYLPMAAAERGGIMGDSPMLTMLHPREMVLPERISQSVQRMASGNGSSGTSEGGGGNHTFNFNSNVSAPDRRGMADLLEAHADDLFKMFTRALRNGKLGFGR